MIKITCYATCDQCGREEGSELEQAHPTVMEENAWALFPTQFEGFSFTYSYDMPNKVFCSRACLDKALVESNLPPITGVAIA